jgi:hypothetical protein
MAVVSNGGEFRDGGIFIWRLENGIPIREGAIHALNTNFRKWNDNNSFIVVKPLKGTITISFSGGKWIADKPDDLLGW